MKTFDLVVVGAGTGLNVLDEALAEGWSCAVVESGKFGGTCLTRGCIPSKILIHPADLVRQAEHAARLGLAFAPPRLDWHALASRMWLKIGEGEALERNLTGARGLQIFRGTGRFTGERRMRVMRNDGSGWSEEFAGERFVLATGARSTIPSVPGLEDVGYVTSETFFGDRFPERPWPRLLVIGGGFIAAEFAHLFAAFGTKVTVLELGPRLLGPEEPEVSALVERVFRRDMDVRVNTRATAARLTGSGKKLVTCFDEATGRETDIECDEIFIGAGRRSNADLVHAEASGVRLNAQGWIEGNEFLETSCPGVWTMGDALGAYQFRHKANADADVLVHNFFETGHAKAAVNYSAVPWAVYTWPQVGHVGLTAAQALAAGHEIYVAMQNYSQVARGFAMGYEPGDIDDGLVKLVVARSGRILGAHVAGPEASILVQPFVYLMNAGYTCPLSRNAGAARTRDAAACPGAGTLAPLYGSMVIHPSLNEVTAWAIGLLEPWPPAKPAADPFEKSRTPK